MPDLHQPGSDRSTHDEGPVPEDNLPGHHPADEQDKPDAADFVAKAKEVAARKGGAKKVAAKAETTDAGTTASREPRPAAAASAPADVAPTPPPTGTSGDADAPTATPEAVVAQAVASSGAPNRAAEPAPVPVPAPDVAVAPNPVAAVLAFQWRVATFPLRLAGEAIERLRRLR